jgi:hypothetical protein
MRKTLVATAVAAILSAGAFLTSGANAMTLTAPAGIRPAIQDTSAVEQTRTVCYRVWRHGHWRQKCEWRPNYAYPGYSYGYPRYYYGGYPRYYYGGPYAYYPRYRRPGVGVYLRF